MFPRFSLKTCWLNRDDQVGGGVTENPLPRTEKSGKTPRKNRSRGPPLSRLASLGGLYFGFFRVFRVFFKKWRNIYSPKPPPNPPRAADRGHPCWLNLMEVKVILFFYFSDHKTEEWLIISVRLKSRSKFWWNQINRFFSETLRIQCTQYIRETCFLSNVQRSRIKFQDQSSCFQVTFLWIQLNWVIYR